MEAGAQSSAMACVVIRSIDLSAKSGEGALPAVYNGVDEGAGVSGETCSKNEAVCSRFSSTTLPNQVPRRGLP
jgi:hypothetical protein